MGQRWIPDDNGKFADMATAFASVIAADPHKYTLDEHDAEMLTRAVQTFRASLAPRFSGVARKEARQEAVQIIRRLGRIVRASDQISDADKAMLRIYPRNPRPSGHGPPTTRPMLRFAGAACEGGEITSGQHILQFGQSGDLRGYVPRQKKPPGVVRVELFVDLVPHGQPIPRFPGQYLGGRPWYLGSFTSSPIRVWPPTPPVSMLVVYWARWADAKCRVGPFSQTCRARAEGWGGVAATPLLGPMPEVSVLERDPKYITTITQLREIEQVTVRPMLPDAGDGGEAEKTATPKQLPMSDAA